MAISEGKSPSLICHAPDVDHAWVHLSIEHDVEAGTGSPQRPAWKLALGYPSEQAPPVAFEQAALTLPEGTTILDWSARIHAGLRLPGEVSPTRIAVLIEDIMIHIQRTSASESIELALEYG
jgi:hypothetical protein